MARPLVATLIAVAKGGYVSPAVMKAGGIIK